MIFIKRLVAFLISIPGKWKKIILILILVIIASTVLFQEFIINRSFFQNENAKNQNRKIRNVTKYKVSDQVIPDDRNYFGEITYYEKVSVSSKVTGKLDKVYAKEGQILKPGDLIAQIERLPLELTLKQQLAELEIARTEQRLAQAKYDNALKSIEIKFKTIQKARTDLKDKDATFQNVDRQLGNKKKLYEVGGVSETELKTIQTQQVSAYTKLELAKQDLEIEEVGYRDSDILSAGFKVPSSNKEKIEILKKLNTKIEQAELDSSYSKIKQVEANIQSTRILLGETTIRSPFWCKVASKNMDAGELVKADSVIANLININNVYLVLNINEKDVDCIRQNQKVSFTVDAIKKRNFVGTISNITPVLDSKTRTMSVKAVVKNNDKMLLPGMFARAVISTGQNVSCKFVPLTSLVDRKEDKASVFVVKKGIVFRQDIELGREIKDLVEVVRGLEANDEIVASDVISVYPGMKVGG